MLFIFKSKKQNSVKKNIFVPNSKTEEQCMLIFEKERNDDLPNLFHAGKV